MTDRHRFNCRTCGADVVVDGDVRAAIVEEGCPICGGSAVAGDFRVLRAGDRGDRE